MIPDELYETNELCRKLLEKAGISTHCDAGESAWFEVEEHEEMPDDDQSDTPLGSSLTIDDGEDCIGEG